MNTNLTMAKMRRCTLLRCHKINACITQSLYGLHGQARTVNAYGHPKTRGPAAVSSFVASQRC